MVQKINHHPAPGCNRSPPTMYFQKMQFLGVFRPFLQRSLDDCMTTALWLLDVCLMTTWQLVARWLFEKCLMISWQRPDNSFMTANCLPDDLQMTSWQLPDYCLTTSRWLLDDFLVIAWQISDNCLWSLPDDLPNSIANCLQTKTIQCSYKAT